MREKRRGLIPRLGLAAVLTLGLMPGAAFADAAEGLQTPPQSDF